VARASLAILARSSPARCRSRQRQEPHHVERCRPGDAIDLVSLDAGDRAAAVLGANDRAGCGDCHAAGLTSTRAPMNGPISSKTRRLRLRACFRGRCTRSSWPALCCPSRYFFDRMGRPSTTLIHWFTLGGKATSRPNKRPDLSTGPPTSLLCWILSHQTRHLLLGGKASFGR
jgi:hypothetical protein